MWRGVVLFFFFFFFLFSFFASTCGAVSYLYKTRARGEKMMEDCSFFFFPREALHPASLFSRTEFHAHTNKQKTNMSIQEYIETHNLSKRVEETINAAVKAKAPEPISFMVGRVWVF